jgi:hypothetical protein
VWFLSRLPWYRVAANKEATEPVKLKSSLRKFYGLHHDIVDRYGISVRNDHGYVVSTFQSFPHSWCITGFVTRLTRKVSLVEQELFTLPEHLISSPVISGVRLTRSLAWCVCFVDFCLFFFIFYFWLLRWLFFFNIRILITPLTSSKSLSYFSFSFIQTLYIYIYWNKLSGILIKSTPN